HTFAQFGSGSLVPGTKTHISRFKLINPLSMLKEARHLEDIGVNGLLKNTSIERQTLITTPFHQATNRIKEMIRGNGRHGSCGMGVGETMSDFVSFGDQVLMAGDLANLAVSKAKLKFIQALKYSQILELLKSVELTPEIKSELLILADPKLAAACTKFYLSFCKMTNIVDETYLKKILEAETTVIFEGAQGVLLDEWFGFYPYTTWSTTTFDNALTLLAESGYKGNVTKLGLVRAYATRHGAGPFVTYSSELSAKIPDCHNENNPWQREFRVGYFDAVATRYALEVCGGADVLGVTNLDRLKGVSNWKTANSYLAPSYLIEKIRPFAETNGTNITDLKVVRPVDLSHQQALTHLLENCQPVYDDFYDTASIDKYLNLLATLLNVPVGLTSYGMTALEKSSTL
ncbi:adenylosuccinate synthetase, partial [Patescibacteria group bacterium]|nr:adenylosuccinate synthetase [Patescibacteria group bacterium]